MSQSRPKSRRTWATSASAALIAAAATFALVTPGIASANKDDAVPPPPTSPTSASQIQNIDQVKTAIKGYYKDTITTQLDPVNGTVAVHQSGAGSAYDAELAGITGEAQNFLANKKTARNVSGQKAILFDIDDTTLNTYNYEIYSNFVYNPTTNAAFVNSCLTATGCTMPAVPHMVDLEHFAEQQGYTVFWLTGRPASQLAGTLANLASVGYDVDSSNVYLKDLTAPWLSSCATSTPVCTTTQYKSLTRQHIESLGYDIVANFGDQYSDLNGGFADASFKIPNPMYYLP